jgi:hypothetical protein
MNRSVRVLFCLALVVLATTPQLPGPIVETPEKPTPAPEQSEAPKIKVKHSTKARPTGVESSAKSETHPVATPKLALEVPARFAGTWSGKMSQGLLGHTQTTLLVDPDATSITLSHNLGGGSKPVATNGGTISWHSGVMGEIAWTLTPSDDGRTAQVTMKSLLVHDSATFRRGPSTAVTAAPASSTQPSQPPRTTTTEVSAAAGGPMNGPRPATAGTQQAEIPTAKPDPNRPGFVYNPFDPTATRLLDVRSKAPGTKVKDPVSGKLFIVP